MSAIWNVKDYTNVDSIKANTLVNADLTCSTWNQPKQKQINKKNYLIWKR